MADVEKLNAFDPRERQAALRALAPRWGTAPIPETGHVNLHMHSFFSYNVEGHSPSRLAWEARCRGLYAGGLCDFDVLDGLEEFLEAGCQLRLRAVVSLETRVYLRELADVEISSPGEPGVTYIMGAGFARTPEPSTAPAIELEEYRRRALERNRALVDRINRAVPAMAIDYERDVLPRTPSGNATERHLVSAYLAKARERFPRAAEAARFWADVLQCDVRSAAELLADTVRLEEAVRSRLVKRGGLGYVPPSPETFPPAETFTRWVRSCGAIPMTTWLDGTSPGEKDARRLLEIMAGYGAAALNIIPDRNWNVADPAQRAIKRRKLEEIVCQAENRGLPIAIGTELNRAGQPFVDDLEGEVLKAYREIFIRGAQILVGHTVLLRYANYGYLREGAEEFPDVYARNRFFAGVGALPPLTEREARRLEDVGPKRALDWLRDQARKVANQPAHSRSDVPSSPTPRSLEEGTP